jgi:hypothetical protein
MTIQSSTFVENVVLFIRDLLRTNVTDPISGRTEGWVMTAYPKRKTQYPIITIKQTNISTQKLGMGSEEQFVTMIIEVRIWARNSKEADELLSDVIDKLRDIELDATGTVAEGIYGFKINAVNSLVESLGDNSLYSKIMSIKYNVVLS